MQVVVDKKNNNLLDIKGLTKGKVIALYHVLCNEEDNNPRMSVVAKDVLNTLRLEKEKFL